MVRIHTLQRTSRKERCPESHYSFRLIPKASSKGSSEVQLGPIKAARKEKQLAETTAQSRWSHIPGLKFMPPSRSSRVLRSDVLTDLIIYRGTICKSSDLAPSIFQVQVWDFDLNLCQGTMKVWCKIPSIFLVVGVLDWIFSKAQLLLLNLISGLPFRCGQYPMALLQPWPLHPCLFHTYLPD